VPRANRTVVIQAWTLLAEVTLRNVLSEVKMIPMWRKPVKQ